MTDSPLLRLDRLVLRNFRCFEECPIELDPQLTVLVAENGRGKTAILEAIGIALGLFVDKVASTRQLHGFNYTDIRLFYGKNGSMTQSPSTELVAKGFVANQPVDWRRSLKKNKNTITPKTVGEDKDFLQWTQQLLKSVEINNPELEKDPPILPLVALYGTHRLWSENRQTDKGRYDMKTSGRLSGYFDCLSSSSSGGDWYKTKMRETSDPQYSTELHKNLPLLAAVQAAMRVVLEPTGWHRLDWDRTMKQLVVNHPDQGSLPLSHLSDGVRSMISLIIDIASRCAILNPHLDEKATQQTPGILLIDEVDMHLHPRWQQKVVDLLRKAFPSLQMVLTTHSPHVLSTVDRKSIRIIRLFDGKGVLETPRFQTRGVESADVLAAIMGVDPIPQVEEARELSDYRALIEQGQSEMPNAVQLRKKLVDHFGNQHPVILECDRMIRLVRFKKNLPAPSSQN